jgi:hypothetical protein
VQIALPSVESMPAAMAGASVRPMGWQVGTKELGVLIEPANMAQQAYELAE